MSNLYWDLKMKLQEALRGDINGYVFVKIDEKSEEMFVIIKVVGLDGVDEFAVLYDHLSDTILNGKSVEDFKKEIELRFWAEIADKLQKKVFKK